MRNIDLYIAVALATAIWAVMLAGKSQCEANGGNYVRGLFWMECVK